MDLIQTLEREEITRLNKTIPPFAPGDTVIVSVNVVEGTRKRVQAYEGVVIAKRNRGLNSAFIVRKISSGEGVERTDLGGEARVGRAAHQPVELLELAALPFPSHPHALFGVPEPASMKKEKTGVLILVRVAIIQLLHTSDRDVQQPVIIGLMFLPRIAPIR